jgi:hypothetical protein
MRWQWRRGRLWFRWFTKLLIPAPPVTRHPVSYIHRLTRRQLSTWNMRLYSIHLLAAAGDKLRVPPVSLVQTCTHTYAQAMEHIVRCVCRTACVSCAASPPTTRWAIAGCGGEPDSPWVAVFCRSERWGTVASASPCRMGSAPSRPALIWTRRSVKALASLVSLRCRSRRV